MDVIIYSFNLNISPKICGVLESDIVILQNYCYITECLWFCNKRFCNKKIVICAGPCISSLSEF